MSDRKLATIRRIKELRPIAGADKIECAKVDGWELVVKKGEFNVGDLAIYVEVDSKLPEKIEFEFMRTRGFKVKTIKLRGQVSQGILFPLTYLPPNTRVIEGADVTEKMGITNYKDAIEIKDPKVPPSKVLSFLMSYRITRPIGKLYLKIFKYKNKEVFPSFIVKTDEERIQNKSNFLEYCEEFYITEKLDGQSATYFIKRVGTFRRIFGVCSRNQWLKTPHDCSWWKIAKKYNIEKFLRAKTFDLYIQGELCGPGIQGNKYGLKEVELFLFNAYDLKNRHFLSHLDLDILSRGIGCRIVPRLRDLEQSINHSMSTSELVELSKGNSILHNTPREGYVIRETRDDIKSSVKVINPDFLLKHDE